MSENDSALETTNESGSNTSVGHPVVESGSASPSPSHQIKAKGSNIIF